MLARWVVRMTALELVLLKRFERRRPAAERIVFGHAVEDMDPAVMKQGRLGDGAAGASGANRALLQGLFADFLDCLEAVAFNAFVFVKWHRNL